jgi:hypothetical protein
MSEYILTPGREDNPYPLLACIRGQDRTPITQATMTAITFRVFQYDSHAEAENDENGAEVGVVASLTVADVLFDTLQTDNDWDDTDDTGYNLKHIIPGARFPSGGKWNVVEYLFNPSTAGWEDFTERFIIPVRPRASG